MPEGKLLTVIMSKAIGMNRTIGELEAEIYRLSLVEARVQALEAENRRLKEYEDFDKTYSGSVFELAKRNAATLTAVTNFLRELARE
jgi:hypothetical protein